MLGSTEVHVVDAVEIHIFSVPRKGGLPHTEVEVCRIHSLDSRIVLFFHVIQDRPETVDVPDVLVVIIQTAADVGAVNWRTVVNCLPILAFQFFDGIYTRWSVPIRK